MYLSIDTIPGMARTWRRPAGGGGSMGIGQGPGYPGPFAAPTGKQGPGPSWHVALACAIPPSPSSPPFPVFFR
eukprot:1778555-Rhodomonas_salina.2